MVSGQWSVKTWPGIEKDERGKSMINPVGIQPPVAGYPAVGGRNQGSRKNSRSPLRKKQESAQAGVKKVSGGAPSQEQEEEQAPRIDVTV
ncbi:MAG: hypothetical protein AB1611_06810 [bacterium]